MRDERWAERESERARARESEKAISVLKIDYTCTSKNLQERVVPTKYAAFG